MKTLFFDCSSGISGDMTAGALIDLGADEFKLREALVSLPCADEFELVIEKKNKWGISGTDFDVIVKPGLRSAGRMGYSKIKREIELSALSERAKRTALSALMYLAQAEAAVHGCTIEDVHFHEVGAVDTLVDICCAAVAVELLGVQYAHCSPINVGGGTVNMAHGRLGVPAPAVARLLEGVPAYGDMPSRGELTTPTGAAIIKAVCRSFGKMPQMSVTAQGFGFGKRETGGVNALRIILGESAQTETGVTVFETNIDDMTPEELSFALDCVREAGALEAFCVPATMKKGRSGWLVCAMCAPADAESVKSALFKHTSTLGLRVQDVRREVLERREAVAHTKYGEIRVKEALDSKGNVLRQKGEYDDIACAARKFGVTLEEVRSEIHQD